MADAPRHTVGELADLGGVSRRTVRYYVQEGLLPAPFGLGRGKHYGPEHLNQLLKVKALQESGHSLDEIRRATTEPRSTAAEGPPAHVADQAAAVQRSVWRHLTLAPGVELTVATDVRMPSPGKIEELAAWCRRYFTVRDDADEETDA